MTHSTLTNIHEYQKQCHKKLSNNHDGPSKGSKFDVCDSIRCRSWFATGQNSASQVSRTKSNISSSNSELSAASSAASSSETDCVCPVNLFTFSFEWPDYLLLAWHLTFAVNGERDKCNFFAVTFQSMTTVKLFWAALLLYGNLPYTA